MAVFGDDLTDLIETQTVGCLNQDEANPVGNLFKEGAFLQSAPDVDEQLLICVRFRAPVKLSGIGFAGNSGDETGPQEIKLFQNKPDIGFADAEDEKPAEELTLTPEEVDVGVVKPVRFVKFQNVSSLQIFVHSNFGADVTKIERLVIRGQPAQAMDMANWKPVKG
uniref:PITH domain-containing protein n=1 Tax=Noctiluca scintillans TaxID=2966 RepID=A0A7S1B193_NOCSC|mmetsp:Transcript_8948/g.24957  ORF Transcript_8948/g.24957 Transcript_8948/m.24957 type:complete len:166 (+) Transcript_8948:68-565(+)|eukprot:CAMPEP_0194483774 /NCGR_PEP_ID=MMETSP0253-20130528/5283_1 /TAXON_ID=2966 /ORGANISM="Noctiluca scintillans" /LENGTH=165 /DNA_ID=CAMNT_0039323473 /DNA_START=30 /DNA_END=527 /DNA_ORIENTATION=+